MKKMQTVLTTVGMLLVAAPAFAVDTSKVYDSGILILVFLGICALFVVSQLIPAAFLVIGALKSLFSKSKEGEMAAEKSRH